MKNRVVIARVEMFVTCIKMLRKKHHENLGRILKKKIVRVIVLMVILLNRSRIFNLFLTLLLPYTIIILSMIFTSIFIYLLLVPNWILIYIYKKIRIRLHVKKLKDKGKVSIGTIYMDGEEAEYIWVRGVPDVVSYLPAIGESVFDEDFHSLGNQVDIEDYHSYTSRDCWLCLRRMSFDEYMIHNPDEGIEDIKKIWENKLIKITCCSCNDFIMVLNKGGRYFEKETVYSIQDCKYSESIRYFCHNTGTIQFRSEGRDHYWPIEKYRKLRKMLGNEDMPKV